MKGKSFIKKGLALIMTFALLLSLTGVGLAAPKSKPTEYPKAPKVASDILNQAGIDAEYLIWGKTYGNYITDVANVMGNSINDLSKTDFLGIRKEDTMSYYIAIYNFLIDKGAALYPTGVFFSEYIEGTSYNKALEIFNATGSAIDLAVDNYKVELYMNGSFTPMVTLNLIGTVGIGDVFIIAKDSASSMILNKANMTYSSLDFNGNDAVVLKKGDVVLDCIGTIGVSDYYATDQTLVRKASVMIGDSNPDNAFDIAAEWDALGLDVYTSLGVR